MLIHVDAKRCHFEVLKFICEKSENKNPQDANDWMPILYAACAGQLKICVVIHKTENNLNPLSNDGNTPLTVAASNGYFEVSQFIFMFNTCKYESGLHKGFR